MNALLSVVWLVVSVLVGLWVITSWIGFSLFVVWNILKSLLLLFCIWSVIIWIVVKMEQWEIQRAGRN